MIDRMREDSLEGGRRSGIEMLKVIHGVKKKQDTVTGSTVEGLRISFEQKIEI
jgi:hypothetical protein